MTRRNNENQIVQEIREVDRARNYCLQFNDMYRFTKK